MSQEWSFKKSPAKYVFWGQTVPPNWEWVCLRELAEIIGFTTEDVWRRFHNLAKGSPRPSWGKGSLDLIVVVGQEGGRISGGWFLRDVSIKGVAKATTPFGDVCCPTVSNLSLVSLIANSGDMIFVPAGYSRDVLSAAHKEALATLG